MPDALPLNEQTIAARLERLPYSRWHVTVTVVLGVAIFFDSFDSLAIAYVLPVLIRDWHIPPQSIGGLISIANFGQALGALIFGWIAERIGRVSAARIAIALFRRDEPRLRLHHQLRPAVRLPLRRRHRARRRDSGRLDLYQRNLARRPARRLASSPIRSSSRSGCWASGIAGATVVPRFGWQWMFIIGALPALRRAGPAALSARNRRAGSPPRAASTRPTPSSPRSSASCRATAPSRLPPVPELSLQPLGGKTRWQELFEGRYRSRTLLVWVLWACGYIIAYGLQSWIPTLYREVYHLPLQQSLNYAICSAGRQP